MDKQIVDLALTEISSSVDLEFKTTINDNLLKVARRYKLIQDRVNDSEINRIMMTENVEIHMIDDFSSIRAGVDDDLYYHVTDNLLIPTSIPQLTKTYIGTTTTCIRTLESLQMESYINTSYNDSLYDPFAFGGNVDIDSDSDNEKPGPSQMVRVGLDNDTAFETTADGEERKIDDDGDISDNSDEGELVIDEDISDCDDTDEDESESLSLQDSELSSISSEGSDPQTRLKMQLRAMNILSENSKKRRRSDSGSDHSEEERKKARIEFEKLMERKRNLKARSETKRKEEIKRKFKMSAIDDEIDLSELEKKELLTKELSITGSVRFCYYVGIQDPYVIQKAFDRLNQDSAIFYCAIGFSNGTPIMIDNFTEMLNKDDIRVINVLNSIGKHVVIELQNKLCTNFRMTYRDKMNAKSDKTSELHDSIKEEFDRRGDELFNIAFKQHGMKEEMINLFNRTQQDNAFRQKLREEVLRQGKEIQKKKSKAVEKLTKEGFISALGDDWTLKPDGTKCQNVKGVKVPIRDNGLLACGDRYYFANTDSIDNESILQILQGKLFAMTHPDYFADPETLIGMLSRINSVAATGLCQRGYESNGRLKKVNRISTGTNSLLGVRVQYSRYYKNVQTKCTLRDNDTYGYKGRSKVKKMKKLLNTKTGMLGRDIEYNDMTESVKYVEKWKNEAAMDCSLSQKLINQHCEYNDLFDFQEPGKEPNMIEIDKMKDDCMMILRLAQSQYPQLMTHLFAERQLALQHTKSMNLKGLYKVCPLYMRVRVPDREGSTEKRYHKLTYGMAFHSPCHSKCGNESNRVVILEMWNKPINPMFLNENDKMFMIGTFNEGPKYCTIRFRELSFNKASRFQISTTPMVLIREVMLRKYRDQRLMDGKKPDSMHFDIFEEINEKIDLIKNLWLMQYILSHNITNKLEAVMSSARSLLLSLHETTIDYNYRKPAEDLQECLRNNPFHNYTIMQVSNMIKMSIEDSKNKKQDPNYQNKATFFDMILFDELWMLMFPYGNPMMSNSMNAIFMAQLTEKLREIDKFEHISHPLTGDVSKRNNKASEPACVFSGQLLLLMSDYISTKIIPTHKRQIEKEWERLMCMTIFDLMTKGTKFHHKEMRTLNAVLVGFHFINEVLDVCEEMNYTINNWTICELLKMMISVESFIKDKREEEFPKTFMFKKSMYMMSATVKVGEHNKSVGRNIIVMSYSMRIFQHMLEGMAQVMTKTFEEVSIGLAPIERREFMCNKSQNSWNCKEQIVRESSDMTKYHLTVNISAVAIMLWLALREFEQVVPMLDLLLYIGWVWSQKELYISNSAAMWDQEKQKFIRPDLDTLSKRTNEELKELNVPNDLIEVVDFYRENKGVNTNCIKMARLMGMGMFNATATITTFMPLVLFSDTLGLSFVMASSDDSIIEFKVDPSLGIKGALRVRDTAHGLMYCASLNPSKKNWLTQGKKNEDAAVEYNSDVCSRGTILPNATRAVTALKPPLGCISDDIMYINQACERIRMSQEIGNSVIFMNYELIHISKLVHGISEHRRLTQVMRETAKNVGLSMSCLPSQFGGKFMCNTLEWQVSEMDAAYRLACSKNQGLNFVKFLDCWRMETPPDAEDINKDIEYITLPTDIAPRKTLGKGNHALLASIDNKCGVLSQLQIGLRRIVPLN